LEARRWTAAAPLPGGGPVDRRRAAGRDLGT